jgi:hypothetical protein
MLVLWAANGGCDKPSHSTETQRWSGPVCLIDKARLREEDASVNKTRDRQGGPA